MNETQRRQRELSSRAKTPRVETPVQNANPFGPNFNPLYIPQDAPIRNLITTPVDPNMPRRSQFPMSRGGSKQYQTAVAAYNSGNLSPEPVVSDLQRYTPGIPNLADTRGSATPGSEDAAVNNLNEGIIMDRTEKFRPGAGYPEGITRPGDYPVLADGEVNTPVPDGDGDGDKGGGGDGDPTPITDKMRSAKQLAETYGEETAEDKAMAIWALSNKELAEKVKPGQSGYAAIQRALGKTPEAEPKEVEALVADSGYTAEEAKNRLEGGATEVVFEKGKEPVATIIDPQAFLSNAIGQYNSEAAQSTTFPIIPEDQAPLATISTPPISATYETMFPGGFNADAIGSYMTPENEDMYKNLFPGARGLNLRTGAR